MVIYTIYLGIKIRHCFIQTAKIFILRGTYIGIKKFDISKQDLHPYLPLTGKEEEINKLTILHLPYYLNYNPQSNFYFASENSDFKVNPYRSEGTYTKYSSLDDKLDNLHFIPGL